jgi:hypothetical protein
MLKKLSADAGDAAPGARVTGSSAAQRTTGSAWLSSRSAGLALGALNVLVAILGAKQAHDEGDSVGVALNLSTIGPQGIVTGPLTGGWNGVKSGAQLMKMQVDCSEIELAYQLGEISADDLHLHYCWVFLTDQTQQDVQSEIFNGF